MLELFIELTNQLFWEGYAVELSKENPAAFQKELAEFINSYHQWIMEDTIYLLIKIKINTTHKIIPDAIKELQSKTVYSIGSTKRVEVLETKIMNLKTKN